MFDPTIFDNLKTVIEGEVYDRDLDGKILVTGRADLINLATMSRTFVLEFRRQDLEEATVKLTLQADLVNLASEILEKMDEEPGCNLTISYSLKVVDPQADAVELRQILHEIWEGRPSISTEVRFAVDPHGDVVEDESGKPYELSLILTFDRKIDERQLQDLDELLNIVVDSLDACNDYSSSSD